MGSDEMKKTKKKAKKNNIDSRPGEESEEHIKTPLSNPDTVKKQDKKKKEKKRKLRESEHDKPRAEESKRSKNRRVITDERFASVHFDPRFQRVPKKESKVPIDSRFTKMLSDKRFATTSAPVDKRGKPKKEKGENPLLHYYLNQDEKEDREEEEERESKEENKVQVQMSGEETVEGEEEEAGSVNSDESSSSDDEDDYDFDEDDDQNLIQSDISRYLMANHDDTALTEEETRRLAVVNMDWDHIKAVDLYVAISSCLPKGGQLLSVAIYPSEFGLKCMEVEAVHGPYALLDNDEEHSEDESDSDDENLRNEKLRTYELNKLRYYYAVTVFDSSSTANHVYKTLDGTELLRTSNVFDLRFIPDSMEFKHPPRDTATEAPTSYSIPDFHTRALQHSTVKLTWEEDEPQRTKILRRKFDDDQLDELNAYLASSDDSDAGEESLADEDTHSIDLDALSKGKSKKPKDREKLRALLLSGEGSGSDGEDDDKDMEITFNTELEDLSKRILEKKDKKEETVWEQVLRKRSEKRKARKNNRSKDSSEDDDDDDSNASDVQEAADHDDDFFIEEEEPLDSNVETRRNKGKRSKKSKKGREEYVDLDEEQEASKAELELLFAEDQVGKDHEPKGYKIKGKKVKGKKGKEAALEAKLPDVDTNDPRFSARLASHNFALDPTDPNYKRSVTYARQQLGKQKTIKDTEQVEETTESPEERQIIDSDSVPLEKDKYELSSIVRSLKRNLGNLKKDTKSKSR